MVSMRGRLHKIALSPTLRNERWREDRPEKGRHATTFRETRGAVYGREASGNRRAHRNTETSEPAGSRPTDVGQLPLAFGGSSVSASGTPTFDSWPQARFDLANSGFNPNEASIDSTNAARLQRAWVRTDDEAP